MRVLVIDDERSICKLLNQVLTNAGYGVESVANGSEGLQQFQNKVYDVVITDIKMNGIGGIEVVNHIRKSDRPQTPVIAISGTPWTAEKGDFNKILPKPFLIKSLVNTVRSFDPHIYSTEGC